VITIALDVAALAVYSAVIVVLFMTPARREDTFGHLARAFVAALSGVYIVVLLGEMLVSLGAGSAVQAFGDSLELLWTPLVLLVAYSMLARKHLADTQVVVRGVHHTGELMKALFETSPAGMMVFDASGCITFANEEARKLLSLHEDAELGIIRPPAWRIASVVHDSAEIRCDGSLTSLVTVEPIKDAVAVIEWPDMRRVRLSVNTAPVLSREGRVGGVMMSFVEQIPWLQPRTA
jgi:PAS domain-containing protein